MKIVIDNKIPFIKGAFEPVADVVYLSGNKITSESVKDADALVIRTRTRCNKELLDGSNVKFIATATIGFDHIDTTYCEKNGITWTNAPGCNSSSVEQYIVSALLYMANIENYRLNETTVGIVGVGNVGSKVARALKILGCKVLLNDPPRERTEGTKDFVSLDNLLSGSDIVSMHVPLNMEGLDRTYHLVDERFFDRMRDESTFINTSRGEVVDEKALKMVLKKGKPGSIILDVFENEPDMDEDLLSRLTLATPHIAGYSTDGKANGTRMSVQAVSRYFNLGLDAWEPSNIPGTKQKEILMDAGEGDELDIISEVYAMTYSVQEDHDRLVNNMHSFEKLRGDYRVRREPSAFSVRLFNDDGKYRRVFEGLGFSVLADSCL